MQRQHLFVQVAVVATFLAGMLAFSDFTKVQAIDFETWKKLSPEKRAELTATSRAMTYYLSGSAVADSDEENGNSYNWRKQGMVTINGELQRFEDGTMSTDRCVQSTDPNDLEKELVEHSYEYNASWGGEAKRFQATCSVFQRGTTCKNGACVPIPPPPDDKVDIKTTGCVDWLFGCVCGEGYEPDYNDKTNESFCTRRIESTFAYNDTASKWEEVVTTINWRGTDYERNPAWIYFSEPKKTFEDAAAAFRAGPEQKQKEKPDRPEEPNECVRDLVNKYGSLFGSCFKSIGPAQRFDDYTACVEKDASSSYRKEAEACGAGLLGSSYDGSVPGQPTVSPVEEKINEEADLIERFKKALIENRPAPEDLSDDEENTGESDDEFFLIGTPYGPFVEDGLKKAGIRVDYGIAFTKLKGGNPEIILPDGTKLDYTYSSLADLRQIPLGTKIVTPPGVEVKIKFSMSRIHESEQNPLFSPAVTPGSGGIRPNERRASIQMGENSEITFDEMYRGFAKIIVNKGDARFKHKLIPLQAASETGVAPITKGTDYGMAYDSETKQTIVEIYDGAIDVADLNTEKVLTTLFTSYGEQIKSIEVAEDKTIIVEKTAIPQSEWDAFVAGQKEEQVQKGNGFWFILFIILAVFLGGGYALYRKGLLRRFIPPDSNPKP